jgi:hypothetical protein
MLAEQRQAVQQQVAEIDGVQRLQPLLIGGVELRRPCHWRRRRPRPADVLGARPRFFQPSMKPASMRAGQRFSSMPSACDHLLHQADLVVGVEDGEIAAQAEQLGMAAQQLGRDRVEGAEPRHALGHWADEVADALLHLARRLVGEGDGEDLRGEGAAGRDEMGDAGGQHAGLAGAGAGEHQHGPSVASTAGAAPGSAP